MSRYLLSTNATDGRSRILGIQDVTRQQPPLCTVLYDGSCSRDRMLLHPQSQHIDLPVKYMVTLSAPALRRALPWLKKIGGLSSSLNSH